MYRDYVKLMKQISPELQARINQSSDMEEIKQILASEGFTDDYIDQLEYEASNIGKSFKIAVAKVFVGLLGASLLIIGIVFSTLYMKCTQETTCTVVGYDEKVTTTHTTNSSHISTSHIYAPIVQFEVNGEMLQCGYRTYKGEDIKKQYLEHHTYEIMYDPANPSYFEFADGNTKTIGIVFIVIAVLLLSFSFGVIDKIRALG